MILGGDITSALTTFAGLGLAFILEDEGAERVRLGWTDEAEPRLEVTAEGYADESIAIAVHEHASARTGGDSWVQADLDSPPWDGKNAVFSPRVKEASSSDSWRYFQGRRHDGIDREALETVTAADVELIGALGEPAYWRFADKEMKKPRPDEGASRWEMKTRNRGEDFVANRLRHLARIVATREPEDVRAGLCGWTVTDEAYKGKRSEESRTATGLTSPRFTDSALAWCALWGISSFPVIHRVHQPSATAGAIPVGQFTPDHLVIPVLVGQRSLGRWRALLVSKQLGAAEDLNEKSARSWLHAHGARAVVSFPVHVTDNPNAPERSLGAGRIEVLP